MQPDETTTFVTSSHRSGFLPDSVCAVLQKSIRSVGSIPGGIKHFVSMHPEHSAVTALLAKVHSSGFAVVDRIGKGGMGVVLAVEGRVSGETQLALKCLDPTKQHSKKMLQRFAREMQVATTLRHPNVVETYQAYPDNRTPFYCMEYVRGFDLAKLALSQGALAVGQALRYVRDVLLALELMHKRGFVHRDVTPRNVLVDRDSETAKLGDFGTARYSLASALDPKAATRILLSSLNQQIGTPFFMAPEAFEAPLDITSSADVYSVGCLLYFLLTGTPPYTGDKQRTLAFEHMKSPFPDLRDARPDTPTEVLTVLSRFVMKPASDRPPNASEALKLLLKHTKPIRPRIRDFRSRARSTPTEPVSDPCLVPNFLLFESGGLRTLVIVDSNCSVDTKRLQKSHQPLQAAKLMTSEQTALLGFGEGSVHPMYDSCSIIDQVIIDASIWAAAHYFPGTMVQIPIYLADKIETEFASIQDFLGAVKHLHGRTAYFAAIASNWRRSLFCQLIDTTEVRTRFAPTPSNTLHLGSARTALLSYLASKVNGKGSFVVRFDDTDVTRAESYRDNEPRILEELEWLGIDVESSFRQSDPDSIDRYERTKRVLAREQLLTQSGNGDSLNYPLSTNDGEPYQSVAVDLRRGPIVEHRPPTDREGAAKRISLTRSSAADCPYYRFAGAIDDSAMCNFVFRDYRQEHLTVVQSHILEAIDAARVSLTECENVPSMVTHAQIDPDRPVPKSIYSHVAIVVGDDGQPLSKRNGEGQASLRTLRREGIRPEAVLAYLSATIFRENSLKQSVADYALAVSAMGRHRFIELFAERLSLHELCDKPVKIKYDPALLRFANRLVLQSVPAWRLLRWLREEHVDLTQFDRTKVARLCAHMDHFANWNEAVAIATAAGSASGESDITADRGSKPEFDDTPTGDGLSALREVVMGARDGPAIRIISTILGEATDQMELRC